jgi:GNAT superfamily N-acetyltransferase
MEYKILPFYEFKNWIGQFILLYEKCFSNPINEKIVKWRYFENPYKDLFVCIAIDKNKIVANYAASPCELIYNGKLYKSGLSLHTMTDPDYTGRGLFVSLASKLNKYMKENGYTLIFGFPNHISNRTFSSKLGWTIMYEIPTLELKLNNFHSISFDREKVIEDNSFSLNYDSCKYDENLIYLNKTKPYLKWRYFNNPQNKYKNFVISDNNNVRSYLVWKRYQEKINIVDFNFKNISDIDSLLNKAIEYALKINLEKITIWSQINTKEHIIFEKYGFKNNIPITYFGAHIFNYTKDKAKFLDFRNWRIHAGDDNVY